VICPARKNLREIGQCSIISTSRTPSTTLAFAILATTAQSVIGFGAPDHSRGGTREKLDSARTTGVSADFAKASKNSTRLARLKTAPL
jgi:hypothetical protein